MHRSHQAIDSFLGHSASKFSGRRQKRLCEIGLSRPGRRRGLVEVRHIVVPEEILVAQVRAGGVAALALVAGGVAWCLRRVVASQPSDANGL